MALTMESYVNLRNSYQSRDLFYASLTQCKMPDAWKTANVCAVFINGNPSLASNNLPIYLLNTLEKVFKWILYTHFFLNGNLFFTQDKSDFIHGDSAVNHLTQVT